MERKKNITAWICSHIRPEVVCTLVTGEATLLQMYGAVISCARQIRDPSDGLGRIWSAGRELRDQDGRTPPAISTESNIKNIKRQINEIAAIYDWDMEVNTTDPAFYKWTQWIFVQMFKKVWHTRKGIPDQLVPVL